MISGSTGVVALLGRPVAHSQSPALHNAWFAAAGLDLVYVALEVPPGAEDRATDAVRTLGLRGANVTAPLKERVVAGVDALDADAAATGAVNTLAWDGPRLVGANTDVRGFARSLDEAGVDPAGRRAVVVGAGGAALAVGVALARGGVGSLLFVARRPERAERVGERCRPARPGIVVGAAPLEPGALAGAELVVVASSGRAEALDRVDPATLGAGAAWVDLNYWDPDPPGLRRAAEAGLRTASGDAMLRAQAALSFEAWTGRPPPLQASRLS